MLPSLDTAALKGDAQNSTAEHANDADQRMALLLGEIYRFIPSEVRAAAPKSGLGTISHIQARADTARHNKTR